MNRSQVCPVVETTKAFDSRDDDYDGGDAPVVRSGAHLLNEEDRGEQPFHHPTGKFHIISLKDIKKHGSSLASIVGALSPRNRDPSGSHVPLDDSHEEVSGAGPSRLQRRPFPPPLDELPAAHGQSSSSITLPKASHLFRQISKTMLELGRSSPGLRHRQTDSPSSIDGDVDEDGTPSGPDDRRVGVQFSVAKARTHHYTAQEDIVESPENAVNEMNNDSASVTSGGSGASSVVERSLKKNKFRRWLYRIPLLPKIGFVVLIPIAIMLAYAAQLLASHSSELSQFTYMDNAVHILEYGVPLEENIVAESHLTGLYRMMRLPSQWVDLQVQRNLTDQSKDSFVSFVDTITLDALKNLPEMSSLLQELTALRRQRLLIDSNKIDIVSGFSYFDNIADLILGMIKLCKSSSPDSTIGRLLDSVDFKLRFNHHVREEAIYLVDLNSTLGFSDQNSLRSCLETTVQMNVMNRLAARSLNWDPPAAFIKLENDLIASLNSIEPSVALLTTNATQNLNITFLAEELSTISSILSSQVSWIVSTLNDYIDVELKVKQSSQTALIVVTVAVIIVSIFLLWILILSIRATDEILHDEVLRRKTTEAAIWRFFPQEFMTLLNQTDILNMSDGDKRNIGITIQFSIIRNFQSMCDHSGADITYDWLMEYVREMGPIVKRHNGFIDKIMSDGIMALYVDPRAAVEAAVEMQVRAEQMNVEAGPFSKYTYDVGIGMHSGQVILGLIGDNHRLEGTIVSDAVNTASRLQGLCKYYGCRILVSHSTYTECKGLHGIGHRFVGAVRVVGREQGLNIFEVFQGDHYEIAAFKEATRKDFERSVRLYQKGKFTESLELLNSIKLRFPSIEDRAAQRRFELLEKNLRNPSSWRGEDTIE